MRRGTGSLYRFSLYPHPHDSTVVIPRTLTPCLHAPACLALRRYSSSSLPRRSPAACRLAVQEKYKVDGVVEDYLKLDGPLQLSPPPSHLPQRACVPSRRLGAPICLLFLSFALVLDVVLLGSLFSVRRSPGAFSPLPFQAWWCTSRPTAAASSSMS